MRGGAYDIQMEATQQDGEDSLHCRPGQLNRVGWNDSERGGEYWGRFGFAV
jgi:hypothetical protein